MRKLLLLFLVFGAIKAFGQNKSYDYCYVKGNGVWVYSIADKKDYLILNPRSASDVAISPDGKSVAYTVISVKGDRTLGIMDLNTKNKKTLKTGSQNCFGPVWSPDGNYIAYNVFDNKKSNWQVAIIKVSGNTSPQILTAQMLQCMMPTWSVDSKAVAVQDMQNVYIIDLTGNLTSTYKISELNKDWGPSSADRFIITNNRIAFSSEENDPVKGVDEPPTAIFIYDLATKSTLRLSPKGYYAWGLVVKGNKLLFNMEKFRSSIPNIYSVDTDGHNLKMLFSNARDISTKN